MNKLLKNQRAALVCGILGCLCYGGGDWLMMYGDPTPMGTLSWLTAGTAAIPQWRYNLAMALAFPGIILYGIALFAVQGYIQAEKHQRAYHVLNIFGLTPWIALHLFYVMILTLFSWMRQNGYAVEALPVCEGLFAQLSWLVPVSEGLMLPVFLYWFFLQATGKTGENGLSPMDGADPCPGDLRRAEGPFPAAAAECLPPGLYQRSDERAHDHLVRDHAGI